MARSLLVALVLTSACTVPTAPEIPDVSTPTPLIPTEPATPAPPTPPPDQTGCGDQVPVLEEAEATVSPDTLEFLVTITDADGDLHEAGMLLWFDDTPDGLVDTAIGAQLAASVELGEPCEVTSSAVVLTLDLVQSPNFLPCTDYDFALAVQDEAGHVSAPLVVAVQTLAADGGSCDPIDTDPPQDTDLPVDTDLPIDTGLVDTGLLLDCGNGHIDAGETCDDGNLVPWDGCNATCTGGCFTWDFNDATPQGWTTVAGDAPGWSPQDIQSPQSGYQLIPDPFSGRDSFHTTKILRSPEFVIDTTQTVTLYMRGGERTGTTTSGAIPLSPADLASDTDATDGLHAMGLALHDTSSGAWLSVRSKDQSGYGGQDELTWPLQTTAPTGPVTLDLFDSYSGSWGWQGVDDISVCALPM